MSTAFTVREGAVSLRVWPARTGARPLWEFEYRDPEHGRRRIKRAKRSDAEAKAREIARQLGRNEFTVTGRQAADYAEADLTAGRWGVTVADMAREFDAARKARAARPALEKTTAQIVEEMFVFKRSKKRGKSKLHFTDLRLRLGRFMRDVKCPLDQVTTATIEDWLTTLGVSLRTQKNFIGAVSNLFRFAQLKGYVPKDCDPVKKVERPELETEGIEVFTPRELQLLLRHISASGLPILAISAFGGLRVSDVFHLHWHDIDFERGHIKVSPNSKTGRRLAPLLPNLKAWLDPLRTEGRVARMGWSGWSQTVARAVRKANETLAGEHSRERLAWKRNAHRHSFASYRCAALQNLDQVSAECGHSVAMLKENYRELVTPEAAKEWFNILPEVRENVIQLSLFSAKISPPVPLHGQKTAVSL